MRQTTTDSALRESEETFRLLFSHNPLPMWLSDVTTREFLEVNNAAGCALRLLPRRVPEHEAGRPPVVGGDPAAHGAGGRPRPLDGGIPSPSGHLEATAEGRARDRRRDPFSHHVLRGPARRPRGRL